MATIYSQHKIVWGVQSPLPLRNFPEGRIRLRLRNDKFAMAFVRTPGGIRQFTVHEVDSHWEPLHEQARNQRKPTQN